METTHSTHSSSSCSSSPPFSELEVVDPVGRDAVGRKLIWQKLIGQLSILSGFSALGYFSMNESYHEEGAPLPGRCIALISLSGAGYVFITAVKITAITRLGKQLGMKNRNRFSNIFSALNFPPNLSMSFWVSFFFLGSKFNLISKMDLSEWKEQCYAQFELPSSWDSTKCPIYENNQTAVSYCIRERFTYQDCSLENRTFELEPNFNQSLGAGECYPMWFDSFDGGRNLFFPGTFNYSETYINGSYCPTVAFDGYDGVATWTLCDPWNFTQSACLSVDGLEAWSEFNQLRPIPLNSEFDQSETNLAFISIAYLLLMIKGIGFYSSYSKKCMNSTDHLEEDNQSDSFLVNNRTNRVLAHLYDFFELL